MIQGVITFKAGHTEVHIYALKDALPTYVAAWLDSADDKSYSLPRFEPHEFAASMVSVMKIGPGRVTLLSAGAWEAVTPYDARYRYVVSVQEGGLFIEVFATHWDSETGKWYERRLFEGAFDLFKIFATKLKDGVT